VRIVTCQAQQFHRPRISGEPRKQMRIQSHLLGGVSQRVGYHVHISRFQRELINKTAPRAVRLSRDNGAAEAGSKQPPLPLVEDSLWG